MVVTQLQPKISTNMTVEWFLATPFIGSSVLVLGYE